MHANSLAFIAASGLLSSLVAALPLQLHNQHQQRDDIVWVTEFEDIVVTVPVTMTVWVDPEEHSTWTDGVVTTPISTAAAVTSHVQVTTTYTPPAPTSAETSQDVFSQAAVASSIDATVPAASSTTSVYVAPTPSSSSVSEAPATSTSVNVDPATPSSTSVAPSSTEAAPVSSISNVAAATASAQSDSGSSSAIAHASFAVSKGLTSGPAAAGTSYTGDLTYYVDGLGACGWTNTSTQAIVAVSHVIFDAYGTADPNDNPLCGKAVLITGSDGSSYPAQIVDRCVGCAEDSLDLSEGLFSTVVPQGNGRVHGVNWSFY